MKRIFCGIGITCILAVSLLFLFAVPKNARAEIAHGEIEGFTWVIDDDGCLTVSGEGEMPGFMDAVKSEWLYYRNQIEHVVIGEGITAIGDYDFCFCSFSDISLPDSLTKIEEGAFWQSGLTEITIPENVRYVGDEAFAGCRDLQTVLIPGDTTKIEDTAFAGGTKVINLTLGKGAVASCVSFDGIHCENLVILDGVTGIGSGAFWGWGLKSVTIPDSVTSIGHDVFCENSESLVINTSSCSSYAARYAQNHNIAFSPGHHYVNGVCTVCGDVDYGKKVVFGEYGNLHWTLYKDGLLVISGSGKMNAQEYKDTDDWYYDDEGTWLDHIAKIKRVIICEGVTGIGDYAFCECTYLTGVSIPGSVTCIGDYAFCECTHLTDISIPEGVTDIGTCAFNCCDSLLSITIPGSVTCIGNAAFTQCGSLESIHVSDENADYCSDENGVLYSKDMKRLISCPGGKTGVYTIPNGVTGIADRAFDSCGSLTGIIIPNSVSGIGKCAFQDCSRSLIIHCDCTGSEIITEYAAKNGIACMLNHQLSMHDASVPDCTTGGWLAYETCDLCDYTTFKEIPPADHAYVEHAAQAPTCTDAGWNAYQTCENCDYTTYTEISATGHAYVEHAAQAPTCTDAGWNAYQTCENCDYTTYTEISATGHAYAEHAAQAPTCTGVGWDAYQTCENCDYTTYAEIPAKGHTYVEHVCSVCGEIESIGGEWGDLHWKLDAKGLLTISGAGKMNSMTSNSTSAWLAYRDQITDAVIEEGITGIGAYAFQNCSGMENIVIPSGVKSIGRAAFYGCSSLASAELPDSLGTLGSWAFYNCTDLERLKLPSGVTTVLEYTFSNCRKLVLTLNDDITSLKVNAFANVRSVVCSPKTAAGTALSNAGIDYSLAGHTEYKCREDAGRTAVAAYSGDHGSVVIPDGIDVWDMTGTRCADVKLPGTLNALCTFDINAGRVIIPEGAAALGALTLINAEEIYLPAAVTDLTGLGISGTSPTVYCYMYSDAEIWALLNNCDIVYLDDTDLYTVRYTGDDIYMDIGEEYTISDDDFVISPMPMGNAEISYTPGEGISLNGHTVTALSAGHHTLTVHAMNTDLEITVHVFDPVQDFDLTAPPVAIKGSVFSITVSGPVPAAVSGQFTVIQDGEVKYITPKAVLDTAPFESAVCSLTAPLSSGDTVITVTANSGVSKTVTVHVPETVSAPYTDGGSLHSKVGDIINICVDCDGVTYTNNIFLTGTVTIPQSAAAILELNDDGNVEVIGVGRAAFSVTGVNGVRSDILVVAGCREHRPAVKGLSPATESSSGTVGMIVCSVCNEVIAEGSSIDNGAVLSLPAGLSKIDPEAFSGTSAQQIVIPSGCAYIGSGAFAGCSGLKAVIIPASVTFIASDAFIGCGNVIICCPEGSYAQQYAADSGILCYCP